MAPARANKRHGMLGLLLAAATVAAGCTSHFEQQYDEAERWRQAAAAAGSEWLETEKLLNEALEQEAQGNSEAALALLGQARFQAEMAVRQAEYEAQAWHERVLR